jgi:hypothetical protein
MSCARSSAEKAMTSRPLLSHLTRTVLGVSPGRTLAVLLVSREQGLPLAASLSLRPPRHLLLLLSSCMLLISVKVLRVMEDCCFPQDQAAAGAVVG